MADRSEIGDPDMSQATFQIAYDGPALAQHSMDVQQLGPALLAVGDLCREANLVINGENAADVNVRVRANFEEGCFDITFDLIQIFKSVSDLMKEADVVDAKTLLEWIGLIGGGVTTTGGSLLAFLKWKNGRKIQSQERVENSDGAVTYKITVEGDGNSIEIIAPVYQMFSSPRVRSAQRGVVAPLKDDGVEVVEVRQDGKAITRLTRVEYESGAFDILDGETGSEDRLEPQTFSAVLVLRAPVFDEGKKWQFWLGENRISATITDDGFNRRVFDEGERFGVGDRFDVKMSLTQVFAADGRPRNEYEIVDVRSVKRGPTQLNLLGGS